MTAAPLIASDPLAAVLTSVTPVGGYVAIALQATLSDVVSAASKAGPLSGPLVIPVDTLKIGPEDPVTGSLANFGSAVALLWVVVAQVASSQPLNLSADLANTVGKLPDLSGFSVGGLDPVTYWNAVVVQTTAAVKPHEDLPSATAYLEAVQLAATYGSAVGDLQMKLLELYTQGMTAFDQLYAAYQAQASWTQLQKSLTSTADQVAAAAGLLQRGYLNIKRSLVLAVEDYRAAFLYQWLQPAGIQIDVSMDLLTLQQQATNSITELNQVLAGTLTGPVRPRQSFQGVTYKVTQATLFTQVNGNAQAQFTMDPTALAQQLDGNTALFLNAATFELEGGRKAERSSCRSRPQVTTTTSSARTRSGSSRGQCR
jgi:hypothetical protein